MPYPLSGYDSQQGRRFSMEDTHMAIDDILHADLSEDTNPYGDFPSEPVAAAVAASPHPRIAFYGVYDGHGGIEAAVKAETFLHADLVKEPDFAAALADVPAFEKDGEGGGGDEGNEYTKAVLEVIRKTYLAVDAKLNEHAKREGWTSGCTCVSLLYQGPEVVERVGEDEKPTKGHAYVANCGDAEVVIGRRDPEDGEIEGIVLSRKHNPLDEDEVQRIRDAGGFVIMGRVMGSLAVTRSFGDRLFKMPYNDATGDFVSAEPFLAHYEVDLTTDEFIIVACDGLWDRLTYQEAALFVEKQRSQGKSPTECAKALVKESLDCGTLDNVTAIVVYLTPPKGAAEKTSED